MWRILLSSGLLLAGSVLAEDFQPGTETELPVEGLENPLVVWVPQDYTADRNWPIVFHYHGTNGMPNTGVPRVYTEGRGFIIVGMEFTVRGRPQATTEFFEAEVANLQTARELVSQHLLIDEKRMYVGGFSKGGWIASTLMESYLREFAGAYLLGAGKPPFRVSAEYRRKDNPAVYIGVGELEVNYPYGVRAIDHFERLGYRVTFDAYEGLGHDVPTGSNSDDPFRALSDSFSQWWQVERARTFPDVLREPVADWYQELLLVGQDTDLEPSSRYLHLHRSRRRPFYRYLDQNQRQTLERLLQLHGTDGDTLVEIEAMKKYFRLVDEEIRANGMAHIVFMCREYLKVHANAPETWHGSLAGVAAMRLRRQAYDFDNWRFGSPAQRAAVEQEFQKEPLPELPEEDLLDVMLRIEKNLASSREST